MKIERHDNLVLWRIRALLLVGAAALISAGIWQREPLCILQKAVTICLECIGIG